MTAAVTVTTERCPRASEHKTEKNVMLRERPDGSKFCPVHGPPKAAA